jgi:hypothetical protein
LGNLTFKQDVGGYTYDAASARTLTPDGAPTDITAESGFGARFSEAGEFITFLNP